MAVGIATGAWAQTFDLPKQLSFEEARQIFLERNPDLKAAQYRAEQHGHEAWIPALWPNPSFSAQRNQTNPPGGGIGSENTLAVEQPLRYPGEHAALRRAATTRMNASIEMFTEEAAELYEELRTRYTAVVTSERRFAGHETATAAVRRAVEIGDIRYQEGDISPFERARLRVALATYEDALAAARKDQRDARIELAYFLSPDPHAEHHTSEETHLTVTDSLGYERLVLNYDDLIAEALARRGLLAAAESEVAASEQQFRAARYARLPNLSVSAGYRGETQPGILAPGFTIGLSVGLPVWHQNQPHIRSAQAATMAANFEMAKARRRIELNVHDAYERLRSYEWRIEEISDEILLGSDQLLDDALYVYEEGEIGLVELLDAVEATRTAQLLKTDLLTEYNLSRYALERALGVGPRDASPLEPAD